MRICCKTKQNKERKKLVQLSHWSRFTITCDVSRRRKEREKWLEWRTKIKFLFDALPEEATTELYERVRESQRNRRWKCVTRSVMRMSRARHHWLFRGQDKQREIVKILLRSVWEPRKCETFSLFLCWCCGTWFTHDIGCVCEQIDAEITKISLDDLCTRKFSVEELILLSNLNSII